MVSVKRCPRSLKRVIMSHTCIRHASDKSDLTMNLDGDTSQRLSFRAAERYVPLRGTGTSFHQPKLLKTLGLVTPKME